MLPNPPAQEFNKQMLPKCVNCQHPTHLHDKDGCMMTKGSNDITGPFEVVKCSCRWAYGAEPFTPKPGEPYQLAAVTPLRDRYLIAPLAAASRSKGGLHLPGTSHERDRPLQGIVLGRGPGVWDPTRMFRVPVEAEIGDLVSFGKYSGQEVELAGQTVLNMAEAEIYAIVRQGAFVLVAHEDAKLNHLLGDYCDICASPDEKAAKEQLELERDRMREARVNAAAAELGLVPRRADDLQPDTQVVTVNQDAEAAGKSALQKERERLLGKATD